MDMLVSWARSTGLHCVHMHSYTISTPLPVYLIILLTGTGEQPFQSVRLLKSSGAGRLGLVVSCVSSSRGVCLSSFRTYMHRAYKHGL